MACGSIRSNAAPALIGDASFNENQFAVAGDLQAVDFFLVPDLDLSSTAK
jgi:hypothetical protein